MDSNKIQELLAKYWECNTSLEEERQLREYFQGSDIPEQFNENTALFRYFDERKKKTLQDASFDREVIGKIKRPPLSRTRLMLFNAMRIAAGISVLVVAFWFVKNEVRQSTPQEIVDTYDDPRLAFEETKKALKMISKSFGNAEQQAKKINLFNEAQEEIQRSSEDKTKL